MKPARFEYHSPSTLEQAVALLAAGGPDARVLAGGQSLIPMMNFRLAAPSALIDLNGVSELAYIREEGGVVVIGAMTRQRAIEFSPVVAAKLPLLNEAIKLVGHLPTRTRGTIGGSIANADPAAEIPMVLQALDGSVVVCGPTGRRTIAVSELFRDAMTTALAADEILIEVRLPAGGAVSLPSPPSRWSSAASCGTAKRTASRPPASPVIRSACARRSRTSNGRASATRPLRQRRRLRQPASSRCPTAMRPRTIAGS